MKKVFGLIFILLGGILIGIGIFMQISTDTKPESKVEKSASKAGVLNTFDLPVVCGDSEMVKDYLNDNSSNKINISYPNCVVASSLNYKIKNLESVEKDVKIDINTYSTKNAKSFISQKRTDGLSKKEEEYYGKVEYSDVLEKTANGNKYYYVIINYEYNSFSTKRVYYEIYAAMDYQVTEGKTATITISVSATNKAFSLDTIDKMIGSISVEREKAVYTNSKVEGNYNVVTLKQNKYESSTNGYEVTFKIPKDYEELVSTSSNIYTTAFEKYVGTTKYYVGIEIETSYTNTEKELAESFRKVCAKDDNEGVKNHTTSNVKYIKVNDKGFYYFIDRYDYYKDNKYSYTYNTAYAYYQISQNNYVKYHFTLNSKDKLTEDYIKKFLVFTVKEY